MRDSIREKDLETLGANRPSVEVDDRGVATITVARDDLDKVLRHAFRSTW